MEELKKALDAPVGVVSLLRLSLFPAIEYIHRVGSLLARDAVGDGKDDFAALARGGLHAEVAESSEAAHLLFANHP